MDYYCDIYDKTIKTKSKNKHFKSLTHNELEKCIRIKHTIENPDFLEIDKIVKVYNTKHIKKIDLYHILLNTILN